MGHYINPPNRVIEIGRLLNTERTGQFTYTDQVRQLATNEHLYLLADRGIFKNAVHLYNEEEFNEFVSQVKQGIIKFEGFFAVPMDDSESRYEQVFI